MTLLLNILILLFIIWFSIHKLNKDYRLFYLLIYVYYQGIITSASLTFIETGIYVSEQGRQSYFVGANIIFLIFFLISVQTLEYAIRFLDKGLRAKLPSFRLGKFEMDYYLIYGISVVTLSLLIFNLLLSASPLFDSSVTRFTYWPNSAFPFLRKVFGNTATFLPFALGVVYLRKKRTSIALLVVYIFYLILIGQKFSPIVRSLYAFFLPWILNSNLKFKFNPIKFVKSYFSIIFFLLFTLVYIKYSIHNPFVHAGAETPAQAIFYRAFGLQAHLFWGSAEQFVYLNNAHSWDFQELYKGMHTLMRYFWYGDLEHIEKSIQNGFSFANAYPAILLKIFPLGIAYMVHMILVASILAPSAWLLQVALRNKKLLIGFFAFQFFSWTGIAFIMGYFNKVLPGILFLFIICLYSYTLLKSKENKTGA